MLRFFAQNPLQNYHVNPQYMHITHFHVNPLKNWQASSRPHTTPAASGRFPSHGHWQIPPSDPDNANLISKSPSPAAHNITWLGIIIQHCRNRIRASQRRKEDEAFSSDEREVPCRLSAPRQVLLLPTRTRLRRPAKPAGGASPHPRCGGRTVSRPILHAGCGRDRERAVVLLILLAALVLA